MSSSLTVDRTFPHLPSRERRLLAARTTELALPAGRQVFHDGTYAAEVAWVAQGALEVSLHGELLGRVAPGEPAGEIAMLAPDGEHGAASPSWRRGADVVCAHDSVLLVASRREFEFLLEACPTLADDVRRAARRRTAAA